MNHARMLIALSFMAPVAAAVGASDASLSLPRSTPEEQGIPASALLGFVQGAEQRVDALHSFMLVRHGHVVAEGWWAPYAAEEPHSLYSLSKSFTSTAVGLAVSDGRLSLDDPVLKFFPGQAPANPGKNLGSMRVRDLLRMCTGQREEDLKGFPFHSQMDLVRVFLELPVPDKPGTHFVYNTAATFMLSAIVQKVTGQTVLDYLRPRLFDPLGISNPTWESSAQGISIGGFGLSLRTEDIARFGQLYLQRGQWRGRQLVPAGWVDAATSLQASNGSNPESDWDQGYCYQFWRCRHGFYRGDGAFGQYCIVMPEFDAVVAITAATKDLQSVLNAVWDRITPAFENKALPADAESDRRLAEKLSSLSLPAQAGQPASPMAAKIAGRRYVFPSNPHGIESIEFEPVAEGAGVVIAARIAGRDQRIECGRGTWVKGLLAADDASAVPIAATGAWAADDTYAATICRYRTPFCTACEIRFSGDEAVLDTEDNVGLDGTTRVRL
ncbi:MAG TPA: serine hydrolase, partial [Opitutaceae bacterium]|nr:serine hydrolase [Opitutaceae bacterium]